MGEAAGMNNKDKVRGVPPESIFVMDQTGNADGREKIDAMVSIHELFESDFKHLEDLMLSSFGTSWDEIWEERIAQYWEQEEKAGVLKQLDAGWTGECLDAAANGIRLTQGQVPVLHRGFLRLQIPEPEEGGRFMKRPSMPMRRKDQQITSTGARAQAKDFATGQLADGARLLEKLLNDEVLPLDAAIQVVIQAMELEVEVREKSNLLQVHFSLEHFRQIACDYRSARIRSRRWLTSEIARGQTLLARSRCPVSVEQHRRPTVSMWLMDSNHSGAGLCMYKCPNTTT